MRYGAWQYIAIYANTMIKFAQPRRKTSIMLYSYMSSVGSLSQLKRGNIALAHIVIPVCEDPLVPYSWRPPVGLIHILILSVTFGPSSLVMVRLTD